MVGFSLEGKEDIFLAGKVAMDSVQLQRVLELFRESPRTHHYGNIYKTKPSSQSDRKMRIGA